MGDWRKLHNEELHILYTSPNIIRQIKSRRMRWAGHVARVGEERKLYKVLVRSPKVRVHSEDRGVDGIGMDLRENGWGRGVNLVCSA
jgi:hypothetical protein